MKIWAHRGCSQRYPENTQIAFEKAMGIKGLEGIELDKNAIQRIESGARFITDIELKAFAKVLAVSYEELLEE